METQVAVGDDAEGPSAEPADLVGGCIASRYALSAVLGRGGMATVYAARDLAQDGRAVALKLMRREMAERSTLRRRFQNEAYVMMTIVDPHVVEVIDMGVHDDGTPFYVMERLEGQSLEAFATGARFAAARVVEIGTQICAGLETAHARGVIHRDLKPD
ncbi:MAG: serine/threonine-protein kinase, partial [Myxococcota bacterium]